MLELISFVGVDESTDLLKLIDLDLNAVDTFEYMNNPPFIEFGFLFSKTRSLTTDIRYPPLNFIKESIAKLFPKSITTSLHLCGEDAVNRYLKSDNEFIDMGCSSRIQLNFAMNNFTNIEELIDNVLEVSHKHSFPLILQSNKSKEEFITKLVKRMNQEASISGVMPNINILYDGSGGFGREIEVVKRPYKDILTGYAGGLKPGNISNVLKLINTETGKYDGFRIESYYIDMESGVRTDNKFDLEKCHAVINEVEQYFDFNDTDTNNI
jgi:hypothetical protein